MWIESINIMDIDGYWNNSLAGKGNGSGSGYSILKFQQHFTKRGNKLLTPAVACKGQKYYVIN